MSRILAVARGLLGLCVLSLIANVHGQDRPVIAGISMNTSNQLVVRAEVPKGYRHAVLEANGAPQSQAWEAMVAGPMEGNEPAILTFTMPDPGAFSLVRIRLGVEETVPVAKHADARWLQVEYLPDGGSGSGSGNGGGGTDPDPDPVPTTNPAPTSTTEKIGHLLNRIAYGPSTQDYAKVETLGIAGYVEDQLNPRSLEESAVLTKEEFFLTYVPGEETYLIEEGAIWSYFKGRSEPPSTWKDVSFKPVFWDQGATGIGYGDGDDVTLLSDMRGNDGYVSVYARRTFQVDDLADVVNLRLRLSYDDGFVAYLNGQEIARENVEGSPPAYDQLAITSAGNVDQSGPNEFAIKDFAQLLRVGENVLAVQIHNQGLDSSDLSFVPALYHAPAPSVTTILGLDALQELVHAQGVYSDGQLQAVLADFWENHFTTDANKLEEELEGREAYTRLMTSEAESERLYTQIEGEAAQMEYQEYAFFHDHALGHFGDLLLYSATSPAMLIYLDNIVNLKESPNENYAREILELYAFGVDNRYTQTDIEALAKCFTGWNIRKVKHDGGKPFPESARNPFTTASTSVESETVLLDVGPGWRYFKGTSEPTPNLAGEPTTAWAQPGFVDNLWTPGATGIGYGDDDDATVLNDMRGSYLSVYARREFVLDPSQMSDQLVIDVAYDDGYVAYLNGEEIGRSGTMRNYGNPPAFNRTSRDHNVEQSRDVIRLEPHKHLLKTAPEVNVLAFQVHNTTLNSSDLSLAPRLVSQTYTKDSIDEASPSGVWTFRFQPEQHDTSEKILFGGTPDEIRIPAGRAGVAGVNDAIEVIDAMVNHRSTREFIVIKLVNKFVSDEISLDSYHDTTAPAELITLVDQGIAAWQSTVRPGHIGTVLRALIDPQNQQSAFWSGIAYRSKVKSAVEYVNSALRAMDVTELNGRVSEVNTSLGMTIFEREEPDGFPEDGVGWMDTQGLLERIKFGQALTQGLARSGAQWDSAAFLQRHQLTTPQTIIDHFNRFYFQEHLTLEGKQLLLNYVNTDENSRPSPWEGQTPTMRLARLRDLMAVILASPDFQFQ